MSKYEVTLVNGESYSVKGLRFLKGVPIVTSDEELVALLENAADPLSTNDGRKLVQSKFRIVPVGNAAKVTDEAELAPKDPDPNADAEKLDADGKDVSSETPITLESDEKPKKK